MTPFGVTMLSVTLKATGIVPSANFLLLAQLARDVVAEPFLDFPLGLGIEVGCVK